MKILSKHVRNFSPGIDMRNIFTACFLICCLNVRAQQPQSSCANADFEFGNFTNYVGQTGNCFPINMTATGIVNGRHTIMTGAGTDPYSLGLIPFVPPGGGNYTVRLGNDNTGSQAEELSYTFTVTPNNALFIYRYAVVLEDPSHTISEQPRFSIRVFDQAGQPINCGTYDVVASANIPGFVNNGPYRIKPWSTVGIDLVPYIGQVVTIEFTTADCGLGAHFGYAYMECYCSPFQINSDFCPGQNFTTLNAPVGFASYLWSTGDTTATITVQSPVVGTTYSCTMTSVTGCQVTLQTTLTQTFLEAEFYQTINCFNNVNFIDSSYVLNGSSVNQWHWDFGDGNTSTDQHPVHAYASPGTYTVQLTAYNGFGCLDSITQVVTSIPAPEPDFTFTPACPDASVNFSDQSVFSAGTITGLYWDFGDGTTDSVNQNPAHTFPAGTYNVSLIAEGSNGCVDTVVHQLNTLDLPVADFSFTSNCVNSPVNFSDQSTLTGGSVNGWTWDFGDGSPQEFNQTASHFFENPGTQTVTLMVQGSNGCMDTVSKSVNLEDAPVADFNATNVCVDSWTYFNDLSTISLGILSGRTWDFGDGSGLSTDPAPIHLYSAAGAYDVILISTATNGCADTATRTVIVEQPPVAAFTASTVCPGETSVFTDQTYFPNGTIQSWQWDFGDGSGGSTDQNTSHVYPVPGTYDVRLIVLGSNGCIDTLIQEASTAPVPEADFFIPSGCVFNTVQFIDATQIASGNIASWTWNMGDGAGNEIQHPAHTYSSPGTYTVSLDVVSDYGCTSAISHDVVIHPLPEPEFSFSSACYYEPVTLSNSSSISSGSIVLYEWHFGDGTTAVNTQTPQHHYPQPGLYPVTLIIRSDQGCVDSVMQIVEQKYLPVAEMTNTNPCENAHTRFTDISHLYQGHIVSWYWDFGDGNTSNEQFPVHKYAAPAKYLVKLAVTGSNTCKDTMSRYIDVWHAPEADFIPDITEGCAPLPVNFTSLSTASPGDLVSWQWDFGNSDYTNGEQEGTNYPLAGTYDVSLVVTNSFGCHDTASYKKLITVYPIPVADFAFSPENPNELYPHVQFFDQSQLADQLSWAFSDSTKSEEREPTHTFPGVGEYTIAQYVVSEHGCRDTVYGRLEVTPYFAYFIPNAFTPNGDGKNDFFMWDGMNMEAFELLIYDRWGKKIYETSDRTKPWDGTYQNQPVQADTYVYKLGIFDVFGQIHNLTGKVTVVR